MEFEFIYDPVPLIIVRNIFTSKENSEILAETIKNKNTFEISGTDHGNKTTINTGFRNNTSSYYDVLYDKDRTKSKLLSLK